MLAKPGYAFWDEHLESLLKNGTSKNIEKKINDS